MSVYDTETVKNLKALLKQRGLDCRGRRNELIERLKEYDSFVDNNAQEVLSHSSHASEQDDNEVTVANDDATEHSSTPESIKILQLQLQIEQVKLQQAQLAKEAKSTEFSGAKLDTSGVKAKLPMMGPQADIISFLASWERCLQLNNVPRDNWAKLLPSCLNERASKLYATQTIADCQDYDITRAFLCDAFKANPSVYRKRLLGLRRQGTDSYKLFLSKLSDLQDHYLQSKEISTFERLKQDNLFHVFMDSLSPEVKSFILSREAETPSDAAKYADIFYSISVQNRDRSKDVRKQPINRVPNSTSDRKLEATGEASVSTGPAGAGHEGSTNSGAATAAAKVKGACYLCRSTEHQKLQCPQYTAKKNANVVRQQHAALIKNHGRAREEEMFVVPMHIRGIDRPLVAYRDTGSYVSLVNSKYIQDAEYTAEKIEVSGIFGPPIKIPVAKIQVKSPKFQFDGFLAVEVGVVDIKLPFGADVLLGNGIYVLNT